MTTSASPRSELPEIVLRAISYSGRRHHGQMRKDRQTPYFAHPCRVLFILTHVFGVKDPEVLCAGVLHDTIEDTTTDFDDIAKEFNAKIAGWVSTLSKDKRMQEGPREEAFYRALAEAPIEVKLCKMADTLDNVCDAGGLTPGHGEKTRAKAEHLLEIFDGKIPAEWRHAYETLRARVHA
jgi:guanosine-3',5'-bis(diphosphate) 3'-pyrophosphohydrolase